MLQYFLPIWGNFGVKYYQYREFYHTLNCSALNISYIKCLAYHYILVKSFHNLRPSYDKLCFNFGGDGTLFRGGILPS